MIRGWTFVWGDGHLLHSPRLIFFFVLFFFFFANEQKGDYRMIIET